MHQRGEVLQPSGRGAEAKKEQQHLHVTSEQFFVETRIFANLVFSVDACLYSWDRFASEHLGSDESRYSSRS
jgi:hypothetical protein